MSKWFEDSIDEKIQNAGKHVILIPARNPNAPIDTVDIYDGASSEFIAENISEHSAQNFAVIWNNLVDINENTDNVKKINISWLSTKNKEYNY